MIAFAVLALVRIVSALALLLVATYYLLASIPFSYYHFLQFPHFWWMPLFISLHPLVMVAGIVGTVGTMPNVGGHQGSWRRYLAVGGLTSAALMTVTSLVPVLQSYETASALCFAPIVLLALAGAVEIVGHTGQEAARDSADGRALIGSAALAGVLVAGVYLLNAGFVRTGDARGLLPSEILIAGGASILGHVGLFVLGVGALAAIQAIGARRGWSSTLESLCLGGVVAALAGLALHRTVLVTLTLGRSRAIAVAVALGIAVVASWQALLVRRPLVAGGKADALRLTLLPIPRTGQGRALAATACVSLIGLSATILPRALLLADWGFALQKVLVFATWLASLMLILSLPDSRKARTVLACGLALAVTGTLAVATAHAREDQSPTAIGGVGPSLAVERYAMADTSVMVLLDLLRPVVADIDFYNTLRDQGDLTDDQSLRPRPLHLVEEMSSTQTYRPHIFVIVIDSLRPDYLSAYNPKVTFTPAIGAFARDSIVMAHAFTPYTGTALSQPAIWAGGLIQRFMYVKPFSAVNNLERLIVAGGYRSYISMDEILTLLLENRSRVHPLDSHIAHPERVEDAFKFDLCATLKELQSSLDRDAHDPAPVFFYTQPQNLHIRVLAPRWASLSRGPGAGVSDFFEPAATSLKRMDGCFGGFIEYLKAKRLYDDSVVILTSDHGDQYGEGGRWGHAFDMNFETIRVPLVIHVPERLLAGRPSDPAAVAFLTDVTPTLYSLLGYGPLSNNPLAGRSLLPSAGDPVDRPALFLLQSSYSRIFGLLPRDGDWFYAANANTATEQTFDFSQRGDEGVPRTLAPADRILYRKLLIERVAALGAYYRPNTTASR